MPESMEEVMSRILIVDDNPINLKLAADVLEAAGFAIDRAIDAEQAQRVLADIVPDLILMDIALPGMDGLSLTRKLKANARNLETRVAQRTAALEATNRELDAFSHSVAHDLRAPLLQIEGFAQLLEESADATLGAESRKFVGYILGAAHRMSELIQALLEFARTSRAQLNPAEVDLDTVLDEALLAVRADTHSRKIQWERSRLSKVRGDAILLRQVLVNLISNAVKYTRTRDTAVIAIGVRPGRADEVVVFVRDNGVGFDLQYADRLFGVFQRLHRADEFEGTGIGLANAHKIVTRHGGSIWAEAAVDRGATFFFSLPKVNTG
jgi:light-regulated signal transduction histidine kinase (bacteriophytochrome)